MPMPSRTAIAALSALAAVGTLAGCAAGGVGGAGGTVPEAAATEAPAVDAETSAPGTASTGADASAEYADGTYTADGAYVAPSGSESITVTVTLADGTVTAVDVVGHATDREAKQHQGDFISAIAGEVVGKPIAGLSVDRVAGSSLTGRGFNAALETIRAEASA
ncbi:MAG: hypothetical protein BGO95_08645 [Micrococcales bacterium 73-13]|nr:MAG: hypothetical protein BGO95_08645 [Micrococcales bacterium 73-13]